MLTEERLNSIVSLVEEYSSVSVNQLMDAFDASESTIRRDLTLLHKQGKLIKVRGGALAINSKSVYLTKDAAVGLRKEQHIIEKTEIARYAASLIEDDDFVFIDAGTTTELMIDFINVSRTTFVTNAISHGKKLTENGYTTYILGGEFKSSTEAIVGEYAIATLEKYNFTKSFFGTNGINKEIGYTTPDVKEAFLKRKAFNKSKEPYILSDFSKFGQISCVTFGNFDEATIITNKIIDERYSGCKNIKEVM